MIELNQETCCNVVHQEAVDGVQQLESFVVEQLADWFSVLADPTRIRIVYNLSRHELCVCDLANLLGMSQSAVSHQLRFLKASRIVKCRRDGVTMYYTCDHANIIGLLQLALNLATPAQERGA